MWTERFTDGARAPARGLAPVNDNARASACGNRSRFPAGVVAHIFRRGPSPLSGGRADTKVWRLVLRGAGRRFREPVMGWTGSTDPLAGLELRFPSLQSAIRYAQRQGLAYRVEGGAAGRPADVHQDRAPAVLEKRAA